MMIDTVSCSNRLAVVADVVAVIAVDVTNSVCACVCQADLGFLT